MRGMEPDGPIESAISRERRDTAPECSAPCREIETWRAIGESAAPSFIVTADGEVSAWSASGRRVMERAVAAEESADLVQALVGTRGEYRETIDGRPRDFAVRRSPLMKGGVSTGAAFVVLADVTERKEAERQRDQLRRALEASRKLEALSTLAGGIAHEMNNLLQPIVGLTSAVMEGMPAGSRDAEALGVVLEAANRAAELVAGILRFSRGSDAGMFGVADLVDPAVEARSGVALLRGALRRGVEMIARLDGTAPMVLIPKGVVERLIVDLGLNAMRAMNERSGSIVVTVARVDDDDPDFGGTHAGGALVRVEDEGEGMPPEVLERCLDPFFTTKPAGEGTGLGLAVVHASVAAAKGRLVVREREGGGILVAFALPAADTGAGDSDERR